MKVINEIVSHNLTFKDVFPGDLFRCPEGLDHENYYVKCAPLPSTYAGSRVWNSVNIETGVVCGFSDNTPVILYEAQITAHVIG